MRVNSNLAKDRLKSEEIEPETFFLGLMSAFNNRYQALADEFFDEITWKQFFAVTCINLFEEPPSITELADVMQSTHQNVKQILLRLEEKGFVNMVRDEGDRRRIRVELMAKAFSFWKQKQAGTMNFIGKLYNGISREQMLSMINTLVKMEENLRLLWQNNESPK